VAAKFEIRSPKPGEYNWVLLSQGRTLATGASYTSKASAEKAIASMRSAAAGATVVDLTLPPPRTPAGTAAAGATEVAKKAAKKAKVKAKKATVRAKKPKAKRARTKAKKAGR
jgi:uncharacterized protein YegP (UPF0339 family)